MSGPDEWPHAACKRNKAYLMDTPYKNADDDQPHQIILMDVRDWYDYGTLQEQMRRTMTAQDARIRELLADISTRDLRYAQLLDRMEALRDVRRAEKRADFEAAVPQLKEPS